jgi:hypothetical protein
MAIEFDDASSEYLHAGSLIVSPPFSVSAWFYVDDDSADRRLLALYGTGSNRHECRLNSGPARTIAAVSSTISEATATSGTGFSVNTWHHGLWTLDTALRTVTLDGGTTASNSTSRAPTVTNTGIGGPSVLMSGSVAELAVWDVDLSLASDWEAVKAALARGFAPMAVRPANLKAWFRLLNGGIHDVIGSFILSANGSPSASAHPRVWGHRRGRQVLRPAAAPALGRIISLGGVLHRADRAVLAG